MFVNCAHCQKEIEIITRKVHRGDTCDHCGKDLKCCLMCEFYDTSSYNECREPIANRIKLKEKSNFCTYYILNTEKNNNIKSKDDLLAEAAKLFKD